MPVIRKQARGGSRIALWKASDPLNAVADAVAGKMRAAISHKLETLLTGPQLDRLARAVRTGDVSAITTLIPSYDPSNPGVWKDIEDTYRDTIADVAQRAGQKALAHYGISSSFSIDNPYTEKWLKERTGELITNISDTARSNIRAMVERGWAEGIPPAQLKQLIKPYLGLPDNSIAAIERRFDSTVQSLTENGMSRARAMGVAADRMKDYADDLKDQRAETIARTETIAASTAGTHDAWSDAKDQGLLPDDVQREWVASPEGKGACPWCMDLDGVRVGFDEPFETESPSADGTIDRPPLHPNCRCVVRLIVPGLNDKDSLDDIRAENEQES